MRMREERLRARESYDLEEGNKAHHHACPVKPANTINGKSFRYMRRQPTVVLYDPHDLHEAALAADSNNNDGKKGSSVNFEEISLTRRKVSSLHIWYIDYRYVGML